MREKSSPGLAGANGGTRSDVALPADGANRTGNGLPLADASRRLRGRAGRPRKVLAGPNGGYEDQRAALEAAKTAGPAPVFAPSLLPRGLPLTVAASYSGVPVRALWRLIGEGRLTKVAVPGCRRVLLLREELDQLLEASKVCNGVGMLATR